VVDLRVVLQIYMLLHVRHNWWRVCVRAFIKCLGFNLDRFLLRFYARSDYRQCIVQRIAMMTVRLMMNYWIVHRIQVANLNMLIEITDVCQFLFTNVALVNDIIGSRGRWQNWDRILSILSILLLMRQNMLLQVALLRV
jgi:hypothetical protein